MANQQEVITYANQLEYKAVNQGGLTHMKGFTHRVYSNQTTQQDFETLRNYTPGSREKQLFDALLQVVTEQVRNAVGTAMQTPSPQPEDEGHVELTVGNADKEDVLKAAQIIKKCLHWLSKQETKNKPDSQIGIDMIEFIKQTGSTDVKIALFLKFSAEGQIVVGRKQLLLTTAIHGYFQYYMSEWLNSDIQRRVRFEHLEENIKNAIEDYEREGEEKDEEDNSIYDLKTTIIKISQHPSRATILPSDQQPANIEPPQRTDVSGSYQHITFDTKPQQPDFFSAAAEEQLQQELQLEATRIIDELRDHYKNVAAELRHSPEGLEGFQQYNSMPYVQFRNKTKTHLGTKLVHKPTLLPYILGILLSRRPDVDLMNISSALLDVLPDVERHISRSLINSGSQENTTSVIHQPYKKELLERRMQIASNVLQWVKHIKNRSTVEETLIKLEQRASLLNEKPFEKADLQELDTLVLAFEYADRRHISGTREAGILKLIQALKIKADIGPNLLKEHKNGGTETKKNGWQLLHFLAAGGMGAVFVAQQIVHGKKTGRKAAVKVALGDDERALKGFERESVHVSGINAPHIVGVYQAGISDANTPYLVTEYVSGPTEGTGAYDGDKLIDCLAIAREQGLAAPVEALSVIAWSLAKGMQEYSEQGLIHRDLKPANVLLTPDASRPFNDWMEGKLSDKELTQKLHDARDNARPLVKWGDFGLSIKNQGNSEKIFGQSQDMPENSHSNFTMAGEGFVVGTPHYMPPEAMTAPEPGTEEEHHNPYLFSDQHAFGIILFQLISGGFFPLDRLNHPNVPVFQIMSTVLNFNEDTLINIDHPALAPLKEHSNKKMKDFAELIARLTTLNSPEERGSIESIEQKLALIQKSTTKAAKKARTPRRRRTIVKNEGLSAMHKSLLAAAGTIAFGLVLYFANMRPEEYIEFGGQRKATYAAMKQALEDEMTSTEKLTALLERYQTEMRSRPTGYEPDPTAGEPTEEELNQIKESIENASEALQLIAEGDDLLKTVRDIEDVNIEVNYEQIRQKYRAALAKSSAVESIVESKLGDVDRMECRREYERLKRAYNSINLSNSLNQATERLTILEDSFKMQSRNIKKLLSRNQVREFNRLQEIVSSSVQKVDFLIRFSASMCRLNTDQFEDLSLILKNHIVGSSSGSIASELSKSTFFSRWMDSLPEGEELEQRDTFFILRETFLFLESLKGEEMNLIKSRNQNLTNSDIYQDYQSYPSLVQLIRKERVLRELIGQIVYRDNFPETDFPGGQGMTQDFLKRDLIALEYRVEKKDFTQGYPDLIYCASKAFVCISKILHQFRENGELVSFIEQEPAEHTCLRMLGDILNELEFNLTQSEKNELVQFARIHFENFPKYWEIIENKLK